MKLQVSSVDARLELPRLYKYVPLAPRSNVESKADSPLITALNRLRTLHQNDYIQLGYVQRKFSQLWCSFSELTVPGAVVLVENPIEDDKGNVVYAVRQAQLQSIYPAATLKDRPRFGDQISFGPLSVSLAAFPRSQIIHDLTFFFRSTFGSTWTSKSSP
jgi:hypothetical protein